MAKLVLCRFNCQHAQGLVEALETERTRSVDRIRCSSVRILVASSTRADRCRTPSGVIVVDENVSPAVELHACETLASGGSNVGSGLT